MQHDTEVTTHLTQRVGFIPPVFGWFNVMVQTYAVDAVCSFHSQWREIHTSRE